MSTHFFMLCLTGGAAVLAAWIVVRFPGLTPQTGQAVSIWLGAAMACFLGTPLAVVGVGMHFGAFVAALGVALPAGTCIFLSIGWLMLYVMRAISPYQH